MEFAQQRAHLTVFKALLKLAQQRKIESQLQAEQLSAELPPRAELGDLAFPLFPFAQYFRCSPASLAQEIAEILADTKQYRAVGPYLNIFFDRRTVCLEILQNIFKKEDHYGESQLRQDERVMIEFSSPNTNKPLHLGHLRNNALGESCARLLESSGAKVYRVNLINDRGVHICKSMLAYQQFAAGSSPESTATKGDHFVGSYYSKYNSWLKENPHVEKEAQLLLQRWERNDRKVRELWQKMNKWAMQGLKETYQRTGIIFDKIYFESQTYQLGKDIVSQGVKQGVFEKNEDGSIVCDLSADGLDTKVVQRSDATSLYITQDLATAVSRRVDFAFDSLVYVVGSEQNYHFKVLFLILKRLGYSWAEKLAHLSYGMVNLPDGKMKSREGTVVDADNLLDELEESAFQGIKERQREKELDCPKKTAHEIALGALHYYLLRFTPARDVLFNKQESLSFNGNTGPYLQYVSSRICSILNKVDYSLEDVALPLNDNLWDVAPEEWELLKSLAAFPVAMSRAAADLNPSLLAHQLYQIAKTFSRFYQEQPILQADTDAKKLRLALCAATLKLLKKGMYYLLIPYMEKM